jgi:hypothetical protein
VQLDKYNAYKLRRFPRLVLGNELDAVDVSQKVCVFAFIAKKTSINAQPSQTQRSNGVPCLAFY